LSKISHAYAKSLFEIGKEQNELGAFQSELEALQQAFSENENFFGLSDNQQKSLLVKNLSNRIPIDILHFLEVLIDNGRFHYLNEIINDFHELVNEHFGIVDAKVFSPVPLEEGQISEMTRFFSEKLKKDVRVRGFIDESLIGGYRVSIGDKVYDNSIKMQLKTLEKQMLMT